MALYDPKEFPNEVETTTDFTLADVLAWARTKPADEGYNYTNFEACAVAQFGLATGRPHLADLSSNDIELQCRGLGWVACTHPWTFGAFADRLEQAMAR